MKILFLCHRFPFPPNRGGKIRPFNIIRHLSEKHDVTVVSIARSKAEAAAGEPLSRHCSRVVMARVNNKVQLLRTVAYLPSPSPSSMGYFASRYLKHRLKSLLKTVNFDLIFVHCSSVAPYVSQVQGVPKIVDFGDMDSQKWLDVARYRPFPLKLGYWIEGQKLMLWEKRLAGAFDFCTATTQAELETLAQFSPHQNVDFFPNGVDCNFFSPVDGPYDPYTISFVGRMDYYPNQRAMLDFCRSTLPLLRARVPSVKLLIVGAEPSAEIRALGKLPSVTVTGTVPDVRPLVRNSALTVAPLNIARGTQNKMLEAMAMGVPVVCSRTALRGVDAIDGEHLLAAETPQEYVDAIVEIISNPARRAALATAGRLRMQERHSWPHSMRRLDGIIERCLRLSDGTMTTSEGTVLV
jgi:sugar transferase (PEP-CTERM/EpsH1 system associated)